MLRISEIYASVQGEGPSVGQPVQFVRFAGCNLKCPGWPCDTQYAINPKLYRHAWQTLEWPQVLEQIEDYPRRIVMTGGEPFLQPNDDLRVLCTSLIDHGYEIQFFTNGTFEFPDWTLTEEQITFVMDWKLDGSGENPWNAARLFNCKTLCNVDSIKFVCVNEEDFKQAIEIWELIIRKRRGLKADRLGTIPSSVEVQQAMPYIYAGAAWNTMTEARVAELILANQLPWLLNVQVHNYVWDPQERRR